MTVGGADRGMESYVDELDWRKGCRYSEPGIAYQPPCATLLGLCALLER